MTRERWALLQSLFDGALQQPPEARLGWLRASCPDDASLADEALALLTVHDTAGDFLESPPALDPEPEDESGALHAALHDGQQLGPYTIREEIGRGGMGIVYLALDTRLGRTVALKSLPPALAADEHRRERLRREARAAAALTHPGIATVHALEEFDGHLFIVTEHVKGRTLRQLLAEGPLPLPRTLDIASDIARALSAAHAQGVVHRDLKPENVLITPDGAVKILDFGIAHVAGDPGISLTLTGAVLGTPAYMAPEQLVGGPIDFRADLYAVGVLLLEMMTGVHPLRGERPALPPAVSSVVERCLAPDPNGRYASTLELVRALEQASLNPHQPGGPIAGASRWWWEFHQAMTVAVYGVMMVPLWHARTFADPATGRLLFIAGLSGAVVASVLRLNLWFASRSYPAELRWVRGRVGRWVTAADWLVSIALATAGLMVGGDREVLAITLLAVGIGAAAAFLVVEPVTERAAFRDGTQDGQPPASP